MSNTILFQAETKTIVLILFLFLTIIYFFGFKLRRILVKKKLIEESDGLGTIEGVMLSLFAFFLGFTFSMSGSRFDYRRQTIISEANAIGTAIHRADLYPDSTKNKMRTYFKEYINYRIAYFDAGADEEKIKSALAQSNNLAEKIWAIASKLAQDPKYSDATRLMIPALNEMIDDVTTRDAAKNAKVPEPIIWVMLILSLCSSFIVGYSTKAAHLNYIVGIIYIVMISMSIYLIIDLDRPRRGLITIEDANNKIIELKEMFH